MRNADFDYLIQVIKQKSILEDPLTQEEHILAPHEQVITGLFNDWLSSVY